jgi:hypothetical protein
MSLVAKRLGIFASPLNRYFSQITLTNRIYLYKIASSNLLLARGYDEKFRLFNKFKNKTNHGFALTYNTLKKNNANEFEIYTFQRFQT